MRTRFYGQVYLVGPRPVGLNKRSKYVVPVMTQTLGDKRALHKTELSRYDYTPLYLYTEKDSLNRITVLKEIGKETYLVAGRYSGTTQEDRLYNPLTEEERLEVQKLLKIKSRDSVIAFL